MKIVIPFLLVFRSYDAPRASLRERLTSSPALLFRRRLRGTPVSVSDASRGAR